MVQIFVHKKKLVLERIVELPQEYKLWTSNVLRPQRKFFRFSNSYHNFR